LTIIKIYQTKFRYTAIRQAHSPFNAVLKAKSSVTGVFLEFNSSVTQCYYSLVIYFRTMAEQSIVITSILYWCCGTSVFGKTA